MRPKLRELSVSSKKKRPLLADENFEKVVIFGQDLKM